MLTIPLVQYLTKNRGALKKLRKELCVSNGDDYQIFYKPFPGEPYDEKWKDDFKPKFLVDGVKVIYDHSDIFTMYNLCDIHIGVIGSAMYPSLMLNKKVVNINNFCRYLDRGNDIGVYLDEDTVGVGDGSAKFWMGVHGLGTVEEFKEIKEKDVEELTEEEVAIVVEVATEVIEEVVDTEELTEVIEAEDIEILEEEELEDLSEEELEAYEEELEEVIEEFVEELETEELVVVVEQIAEVGVENLAVADEQTVKVVQAVVAEVVDTETVAELSE